MIALKPRTEPSRPDSAIFFMFFVIFLPAGGRRRRRRAVAPTPTPLVSTHTHPKSLSRAVGEKNSCLPFCGAGVVSMSPQRPGDHFYHVKTPNGATWTRFSPFLMFSTIFLYKHSTSLCQTDTLSLCGTPMSLWRRDSPSVPQRQSLCPTETVLSCHLV